MKEAIIMYATTYVGSNTEYQYYLGPDSIAFGYKKFGSICSGLDDVMLIVVTKRACRGGA